MAQYLRDFAKAQEGRGLIHYNTTVTSIDRFDGPANVNSNMHAHAHAPFLLKLHGPELDSDSSATSAHAYRRVCRVVVVATGLNVPNAPKTIAGIERAIGWVLAHSNLHHLSRLLDSRSSCAFAIALVATVATLDLKLPGERFFIVLFFFAGCMACMGMLCNEWHFVWICKCT